MIQLSHLLQIPDQLNKSLLLILNSSQFCVEKYFVKAKKKIHSRIAT